mgnify:CR=1 FL=1
MSKKGLVGLSLVKRTPKEKVKKVHEMKTFDEVGKQSIEDIYLEIKEFNKEANGFFKVDTDSKRLVMQQAQPNVNEVAYTQYKNKTTNTKTNIKSDKKEFKPKFKFNKDADRVEPAESETEKWLRDNEEKYNRRSSYKHEENLFGSFQKKPYSKIVKVNSKPLTSSDNLRINKKSHQRKIHDINLDVSTLIKNEKIPDIFTILKDPDLRAMKKALANIHPGDEVFERKLLDYKTIELLKIFTIMNSDKIEKYPILKKYKISKFDQRVAIAIRLLLNASTKLNLGEEKVYESVFVKAKARLKYDTFFDEVLGNWHDTIELLDDREILKDSTISHSKEVIKFATCDTLLNINDAVRVSLMKYLFIDFKESKHISLKYSTIKMIEMIKKYSLRYLNSFSNLDWDLSESRYKLIRNTLSKEKTNKFNYVVTDEILKISNLSKSFGKVEVLKDLSFGINKGEVHVIMGQMVQEKVHWANSQSVGIKNLLRL